MPGKKNTKASGKTKKRSTGPSVAAESERSARLKAQIQEGALRAFLSQGYSATMDSIALESGVVKQTLYAHFDSKEMLFAALMDRLLDKFLTAGMTPDLMSLEPPQFLRKVAQITLARMDDWEYICLLRLLISESSRFPELAELYISRLVRPGIDNLTEYLRKSEKLRFADPEATARLIHGSLLYFIILQELLDGKHTVPLSRERMAGALVDLVVYAGERAKDSR